MTTPNYTVVGRILALINSILDTPYILETIDYHLTDKIVGISIGIRNGSPLEQSYYDLWRVL